MSFEIVNPEALGPAKGYANGVLVPAGARMLFVAGQVGWDREHRFPAHDDPAERFVLQYRAALASVVAVVKAAGGSPEAIVRLTTYVTDKRLYNQKTREVGKVYRELVGRWFPAMTLVEVKDLLEDGALVELEATAALAPPTGDKPA